jgi:hypothetical protein
MKLRNGPDFDDERQSIDVFLVDFTLHKKIGHMAVRLMWGPPPVGGAFAISLQWGTMFQVHAILILPQTLCSLASGGGNSMKPKLMA